MEYRATQITGLISCSHVPSFNSMQFIRL